MSNRMLTELATLPVASTSFTKEPTFIDLGGDAELAFEYLRHGATIRARLVFHRVRAYRFRAESHATSWHLEGYDTLVAVSPSDWLTELGGRHTVLPKDWPNVQHFLIYFDGSGAYEVAAASWSWGTEEVLTV